MTITLAVTAKWPTYPKRLDWILNNGFALEYAPNPEMLESFPNKIDPFLEKGLVVRYHAYLPSYEIGHANQAMAERGLQMHKKMMDQIHGKGEPVLTVHIGLRPADPIDKNRAISNLKALVDYGKPLGLTICLENLRRGLTSDPSNVYDWAEKADSKITLDIGHAISCDHVKSGKLTAYDYINKFADRLHELHLYGYESDRHYPPQSLSEIEGLLDIAKSINCNWWTIELDDYDEIQFTKGLVSGYLKERG